VLLETAPRYRRREVCLEHYTWLRKGGDRHGIDYLYLIMFNLHQTSEQASEAIQPMTLEMT
jgi:hypothetical protein